MSVPTGEEFNRLRHAMLLGTSRQPLAAPASLKSVLDAAPARSDPTLILLSLAGQRRRFEWPARSSHDVPEAARRMHADPRPILPDGARRTLGRLAGGLDKSLAAQVVPAAVRRIADAGFRPHPFDLPWLVPFLKTDAGSLGLAERAFLVLSEPPGKKSSPDILHAEISTENWTEFPKSHRCRFLQQERSKDPAAARALLEAAFKSEPAAVRAELIGALAVGLGPNDLPFLTSLANDRSDSVKQSAALLLGRVRGMPAHAARVKEAARCFKIAEAAVTFVAPKTASARERAALVERLFDGVSLGDLVNETGLAAEDLLAALPEDDRVWTHLHFTAAQAGDRAAIRHLVEAKLTNARTFSPSSVLSWPGLDVAMPVSEAVAVKVLASPGWADVVQKYREAATAIALKDDGSLVMTATMLPASVMPAFLDTLAPLLPGTVRSARDFAELILTLAGPPSNVAANKT